MKNAVLLKRHSFKVLSALIDKNSYLENLGSALRFFFLVCWRNHMIVKLGMKSVPGNNSSIKFPTPPNAPFHPPKTIKKIIPDSGAHIMSENSPRTGTP